MRGKMEKRKKLDIYIDGGSRGNPGHGACAVAIFDERGNLIHEEVKYLGICTNNFAEYNALMQALVSAKYLKVRRLNIFSDSELLVKQFNGEYRIKDEVLLNLMSGIRKEAERYEIKLSHVSRSKNKYADKLVNQVLDDIKVGKKLGKSIQKESEKKFHQPGLF